MDKRIYFLVSILIIASCILIMSASLLDITQINNYVSVGFKTALALSLSATAFLLYQLKNKSDNNRLFYNMLSQIVFIIGAVSLSEYAFNYNSGFDQLAAQLKNCEVTNFADIRMSLGASICFTLLGTAFLITQSRKKPLVIISHYLLHMSTAISSISLIAYLYRSPFIYKINLMDFQTSLMLAILSLAASGTNKHLGLTSIFYGNREGNFLSRKIFPKLAGLIIVLGFIRVNALHFNFFTIEFETTFLVIFLIGACFIITWQATHLINIHDQAKTDAEKSLSIVNYSLGKIILDRTTELNQALEQLEQSESRCIEVTNEKTQINLQPLVNKLTEQNEQLTNFAHITSHNLRGPISSLNSLLYFYKYAEGQHEKDAAFAKFEGVTFQLTQILNELIEAIKAKENTEWQLETISFEEILKRTNEMIISQIKETGAIITNDFSHAPEILYKKAYMESILLNLIINAIRYRSPERKPEIHIETHRLDGFIELVVRDNGLGIDMQRHGEKLFGFRKTFHRNIESKGAGLFIAKAQVEALGGHITATSEVNKGTTFKIIFNQ